MDEVIRQACTGTSPNDVVLSVRELPPHYRGKVALISLRFKPAFVSLLVAFGKAFSDLGLKVEFVLDSAYVEFAELSRVAPIVVYSKTASAGSYTHGIFFNVSVHNQRLASSLKNEGARIAYVYHEPWQLSFSHLKSEGIRGSFTSLLAHQASIGMLKVADTIILPSRYGGLIYGQGDIRHNPRVFYIPLLFDDEGGDALLQGLDGKRYFSYMGAICRAHGFDQYLSFMRHSFRRNLGLKFMIASALPLPAYVMKDNLIQSNLDKITIQCGRPLQNDEINKCYAASFCVWNLYRRSTQSAVLPKAFMFGTPVIANRTGAFPEFIKDGYSGRFASANDDLGIESALEDIRQNLARYSNNCRDTFLNTFFYRSNLKLLEKLLEQRY